MIGRVIGRIVSRTGLFAVAGALLMAIAGAAEGAAVSGMAGLFAVMDNVGGVRLDFGVTYSTSVLVAMGIGSGLLAFGLAGALTSARNDLGALLKGVSLYAVCGSLLGVALGAVTGAISFPLWTVVIYPNVTNFQPAYGSGESILNGCFFGVIGGFVLGTFCGALYRSLSTRFRPTGQGERAAIQQTANKTRPLPRSTPIGSAERKSEFNRLLTRRNRTQAAN